MKTLSTRARVALAALVLAPFAGLAACTDLSVDPYSSVPPENFYQTETEVIAALSPVYSQLRGTLWAYHNVSQVSSDENIVPTRGADWYDNGDWLSLHQHSWTPTLGYLNDAWNTSYAGVARANSLLRDLGPLDVANKDGLIAEIRGLRAFYYYTLLDLFGNVPIIGDEEGEFTADPENPPSAESRADVFAFVASELEAVRGELPVAGAGNGGRFSQGAADAILASLYLNAEVFTGTVSAGGLQRGPAMYDEAEAAATRLINGPYSLNQGADDWLAQFGPTNQDNPEHIFVVQHLAQDGYGVNFALRWGHYNSFAGGGWNGFSTIAETYNAFDDADPRKKIFLQGQAYNVDRCDPRVTDTASPEFCDAGDAVNNRDGEPLIFSVGFPNGVTPTGGGASEGDGVRVNKFALDRSRVGQHNGNDYPYFRLGEMYLIRAEARLRQGDATGALADVNVIRERIGVAPLASVTLDAILQERLYEMTYEARRRQDLIRFDRFVSGDWSFKDGPSEPYRVLFPIPQLQVDASDGNLAQNPGY